MTLFQMSKRKHQAIERLETNYGNAIKRLCDRFHNEYSPPEPETPNWKPKNPEIVWPSMKKEEALSKLEWAGSGFPSNPLPKDIIGVVDVAAWEEKVQELSSLNEVDHGLIKLMKEVKTQLSEGASSHVRAPGTNLTQSSNWLPDPALQIPKVVDALASFVKAGHMAGPIFHLDRAKFKVNSIMAVIKPGGHVRVVGNLKSPKGQSFNEGIAEERKQDWPVSMTTVSQFAKMVFDAGPDAYIACSDVVDAYKMIPVSKDQRKLQAYHFCGALFIEIKLVFGDKLACQYFDRFHYAILHAFVYPSSYFPPVAQGRTVDDIPSVVPSNAKPALVSFVRSYRASLKFLNLRAAEDDPSRTKAFDCAQEGEVLGVRFNTKQFTWSLPHVKLLRLVNDLRQLARGHKKHSLRELEKVMGKLNHVAQLCPPLKTFTSEAVFLLGEHIRKLSDKDGQVSREDRDHHIFHAPQYVCQDLLMVAAIMADTHHHPLPIVDPDPTAPLCAMHVYTDASGHIAGPTSPALGIFFPPQDLLHARADSLPFPTDFLLQSNGASLVADTSSTLESLGILIPMMIDPGRCAGKSLHFHIDNYAVVSAFKKRRSGDKLTHTVIRAAYLLAGALACKLHVSWIPRRSERLSVIADDLTHINFQTALTLDPSCTTTTHQAFPPPVSSWMWKPQHNRDLGHEIVAWMRATFSELL